jgi:hypothetical protein
MRAVFGQALKRSRKTAAEPSSNLFGRAKSTPEHDVLRSVPHFRTLSIADFQVRSARRLSFVVLTYRYRKTRRVLYS